MRKLTLLAILLPAVSLANGYDVPNVNPRDLAMAGSAVAAQVDAEAAYQNPAALSRLDGLNLSLAGSILDNGTKWTAAPGSGLTGTAETKFMPAPPVSLFAAYGFKAGDLPTGIGLGMNVPAGGNVFWQDDWQGRGRIITVDRKIYAGYLTAGMQVLPQLRLGAGAIYYYGVEYLKQGVQPDPSAYGELATKGGALSFDVSAEVTPMADLPLTIGVDYKHKATMKMTGDAHFAIPPALQQPQPGVATPIDQNVSHHLTYPSILHTGVGYRVVKPLLVTFDFTYNWYEVYKDDTFAGSAGTTITVPRDYGNGYTFRLGGEYDLNPQWQLRAGVLRDISGFKTETYSPTLPDGNVWAGSLGTGFRFSPDVQLNAAFFYAWYDKVTATGAAFAGSYDTQVWIASLGLTWHIDMGGPK